VVWELTTSLPWRHVNVILRETANRGTVDKMQYGRLLGAGKQESGVITVITSNVT
jgi:hypothetical protein